MHCQIAFGKKCSKLHFYRQCMKCLYFENFISQKTSLDAYLSLMPFFNALQIYF